MFNAYLDLANSISQATMLPTMQPQLCTSQFLLRNITQHEDNVKETYPYSNILNNQLKFT